MASGKKSFILYADQLSTFNELSDKEAGVLIKHILKYVNDENPVLESKLLKIAFEPIRLQLKRDLKYWEEQRQKRSEAGKLGGIKSGESRKSEATLQSASKNEANEAVNVNVTVNDTVTVNEEEKELSLPFSSENFLTAWNEILTTKKWKKKTPLALQKSLNKLGKFDEEIAIEMINNAIAGEWQGFHEIKGSSLNIKKTEVNGHANTKGGNKPGTSEARVTALEDWSIGGKVSNGA